MKKVLLKIMAMVMCFVMVITTGVLNSFAVETVGGGIGNIDGDNRISVLDALLVLQFVVRLEELTEEQQSLADCDFDGEISIVDALVILQAAVGLARLLSDDFSGDLSQWTNVSGDWEVENGILKSGEDGILLLNDIQDSCQIVSVNLCASLVGACNGVILWYQDDCNFIAIKLCPQIDRIWIEEKVSGLYSYTSYRAILDYNEWYEFKVNTDSSGLIKVYLNNNLAITYTASTPNRFGSIGLVSAGASYDGFKLLY